MQPASLIGSPPRVRDGLGVLLGVLALHALLLSDTSFGLGAQERPDAALPQALTVRRVVVPAAQTAPAAVPPAALAPKPPRRPVPVRSTERPVEPASPIEVASPLAEASVQEMPQETAAPVPIEGAEPPVYATRPAPPVTLAYDLRRGALTGRGELRWQHDGAAYELSLTGSVFGVDVLSQVSRGSFDAAGLAPERFVDRRRGRDRSAANFDRAAGRITFSGPGVQYPLVPGAQDRLSWMLQLPAIVDADPARWTAGARIALFVAGARGDGEVWTFVVQGPEPVDRPAGRSEDALRITREPRRPYDTQVEVWLDPARHHLPVRARLTTLPGGDTLELLLLPLS